MSLQDELPLAAVALYVAAIQLIYRTGLILQRQFGVVAGNEVVQAQAILEGAFRQTIKVFIGDGGIRRSQTGRI